MVWEHGRPATTRGELPRGERIVSATRKRKARFAFKMGARRALNGKKPVARVYATRSKDYYAVWADISIFRPWVAGRGPEWGQFRGEREPEPRLALGLQERHHGHGQELRQILAVMAGPTAPKTHSAPSPQLPDARYCPAGARSSASTGPNPLASRFGPQGFVKARVVEQNVLDAALHRL